MPIWIPGDPLSAVDNSKAIEAGLTSRGRTLADFSLDYAPMIAVGRDEATLARAVDVLRNRIAARPVSTAAWFAGAYVTGEFAITQAMSSPLGETLVCEAIVIAVTLAVFTLTARLRRMPAS